MTQHDPGDADALPSPADALEIIAAQRALLDETRPSGPLLFGVWGAAWLLGYGLIWLTARDDDNPAALTAAIAITGGFVALVVTIVHVIRRTRGIVGASSRQGAMYGVAWSIGFTSQGLIVSGFAQAGAPGEVMALAGNAIAALIVGLLYLAGGMLWDSIPMYAIGGWMALVGGGAALVGLPGTYLVMAVAGGGGMLAAGVIEKVRARA